MTAQSAFVTFGMVHSAAGNCGGSRKKTCGPVLPRSRTKTFYILKEVIS